MDSATHAPDSAGRPFGAGPGSLSVPIPLLERVEQATRLLAEIHRDLGLAPLGIGGRPVSPPGASAGVASLTGAAGRFRDSVSSAVVGSRFERLPTFWIAGVEATQSVQFFNIDKQSSGAGADNSVPPVANKELVLRVYVETGAGFSSSGPPLVTGTVRIGGQVLRPWKAPIRPLPANLLRRANLGATLNFRIPAALCHDTRSVVVRVYDVAADDLGSAPGIRIDGSPTRFDSTSESFALTFRDVPPMRLTGVMMHFTGNGLDLPAPPGTSLVDTVARFLPMLPIHGFDFGPCVPMDFGGDLKTKAGWDTLLNTIADLRSGSTARAIFVGLIPANLTAQIAKSDGTRGIGRAGLAVGARDDTRALSHEIGHAALLDHVAAGGAPAPFDTSYPTYGSFPFGSIGEFGLNTARMTLFDPATAQDLMTYSDGADVPFPSATWISPHNYVVMMNALVVSDGTGDYAIVAILTVAALINFRIHRGGKVELLPSYQVSAVGSRDANRPRRAVMLDLIGHDGAVIASHHCHEHNPYQDPDGAFLDFHEVLPWSSDVAEVVVVRNGVVLDTIRVNERQPELRLGELHRVTRDGDLARVEWTVSDGGQTHQDTPPGAHHAMVRYSNDDGHTWQALAAGLTATRHLVDLDGLPGGERCRLEVIVSSGLRSTSARTEPFAVRRKARRAYLASPRDGDVFEVGQPVAFIGGGHSPEGGVCAADEVTWRSNRDGTVGTGAYVVSADLRPGTHRITLTLPDGAGGEAGAGIWIKIVDVGGHAASHTAGCAGD